jgi:DNA-binding CsgD family transcriptional regulator
VTTERADDILSELRKIGRLLTLLVTQDMSQKEKIALLSTAGFQPKEIAELLGTTPNTVSVTLAQMRRQQGTRPRGRGAKRSNET